LRIQKTLEDANIKLDSVITDVLGLSGRKMIEALIAGQRDPAKLARLADRRVKASQETLREALRGRVTKNHRFLLRLHLDQIDALDVAIAKIDREVEAGIAPFRTAVEQVSTIPGVKDLSARTILSEIGIEMSRFATDAHLISWACLCPRSDESAGKRRSTRIRKGSPWLKTTLVQCAWAAARTKGSYLQAQFHRIRARRGVKKAIVAVAASILTAHLSHAQGRNHVPRPRPQPLGCPHQGAAENRLIKRLTDLGYTVELVPLAH
jgi:transposase